VGVTRTFFNRVPLTDGGGYNFSPTAATGANPLSAFPQAHSGSTVIEVTTTGVLQQRAAVIGAGPLMYADNLLLYKVNTTQ